MFKRVDTKMLDVVMYMTEELFNFFIFCRSLSPQAIQTIVEKGCPSLYRKAVNSAKRLRAHLELDEGEVLFSLHFMHFI